MTALLDVVVDVVSSLGLELTLAILDAGHFAFLLVPGANIIQVDDHCPRPRIYPAKFALSNIQPSH